MDIKEVFEEVLEHDKIGYIQMPGKARRHRGTRRLWECQKRAIIERHIDSEGLGEACKNEVRG